MSGEQKKFKIERTPEGLMDPDDLDDLIQKEYLNGYEPLSVCLDCSQNLQFIVIFKKIEKVNANKKSKSRYESVRKLIEK